MVSAQATAKYIRTSSQKAGLVLDLIRGKNINQALAALQFSRKAVARDVAKVLRSAVANAQQNEAFGGDVERLYVSKCHADNGPSMKRVRPAPMGRAFRIVKRTTCCAEQQQMAMQLVERYFSYPPVMQQAVRPVYKKSLFLLGFDDVDTLLPPPVMPIMVDPMTGQPVPAAPGMAAGAPPPEVAGNPDAAGDGGGTVVPFAEAAAAAGQ